MLPAAVNSIPYEKVQFIDGTIRGNIPILDVQFGNIWTNIERQKFMLSEIKTGDRAKVTIFHLDKKVYSEILPYVKTFGDVAVGEPAIYINDLLNVAFALNQDNFAVKYNIKSGPGWSVQIIKQ